MIKNMFVEKGLLEDRAVSERSQKSFTAMDDAEQEADKQTTSSAYDER